MSNYVVYLDQTIAEKGICKFTDSVEVAATRGTTTITTPHLPGHGEKRQAARVDAALQICKMCPALDDCAKYAGLVPPMVDGTVLGGIYFGVKSKITKLIKTHNVKYPKNKIVKFTKWDVRPTDSYDFSADKVADVIDQEILRGRKFTKALEDSETQRYALFLKSLGGR